MLKTQVQSVVRAVLFARVSTKPQAADGVQPLSIAGNSTAQKWNVCLGDGQLLVLIRQHNARCSWLRKFPMVAWHGKCRVLLQPSGLCRDDSAANLCYISKAGPVNRVPITVPEAEASVRQRRSATEI